MVNSYKIQRRARFSKSLTLNSILIIVNVLAFFIFTSLIALKYISLDAVAIRPSNVIAGKYLWTFVTSMFMHGGFFHLFVNMLSLFFVGSLVEKLIGRKRYFWFYMFAGIFAGLFFVLCAYFLGNTSFLARVFGSPDSLAVGASGAIFGLLGILAVLIPRKKIYLIAGPLIAIILQSVFGIIFSGSSALSFIDTLVTIYIFIAIFAMFSFNENLRKISLPLGLQFWLLPFVAIVPLILISFFVELPIGNMAHLGGLIAGLGYGFYLRKKFKRKTSYLRKYFV